MLGMPLLGWIAVSAKGAPITMLGWPLPMLIGPDKELYSALKEIHQIGGTVGYYLVGLHAAAALIHHYVIRDTTLRRMLPARHGAAGFNPAGR
jgi:cytochrome b561